MKTLTILISLISLNLLASDHFFKCKDINAILIEDSFQGRVQPNVRTEYYLSVSQVNNFARLQIETTPTANDARVIEMKTYRNNPSVFSYDSQELDERFMFKHVSGGVGILRKSNFSGSEVLQDLICRLN